MTSKLRVLPRQPHATSSSSCIDLNERKTTAFKHPGYPDQHGQNVLLRLRAYDDPRGGIHHRLALTVCGLLAGNRWDGYLTIGRDDETPGFKRVDLEDDDVLLFDEYYFHLPNQPLEQGPYPIYRSFRDWSFPHGDLPSLFGQDAPAQRGNSTAAPPSASRFSVAILNRDMTCRVTDSADYIQAAHICPASENPWFGENNMSRYNANESLQVQWAIDDISNGLALRPDIHKAFDDRKFTLVPKQNQWVVHFFGRTNNLGPSYHNQVVDIPSEVHPAFLLTRLAWTIFPLIGNFLNVGIPRVLTARVKADTVDEATTFHTELDLRLFFEASKSRRGSESPQKGESPHKRRAPCDDDDQTLLDHHPTKRRYLPSSPSATIMLLPKAGNPDARTTEQPGSESHPVPVPKPWELQSCSGNSEHSLLSYNTLDLATPNPHEDTSDLVRESLNHDRYILSLKRKWILAQRPTDTSLYCCNYEQAERIAETRLHGQKRPLCWQCLGYES